MRKKFLLPPVLLATVLMLYSCKKETNVPDTPQTSTNEKIISKIKSWLDQQKKELSAASLASVESLELNLNYEEIWLEKYKGSKEFIVIPVSSGFKSKNNADKDPVTHLILVFENRDSIITGNIIQYISSNDQKTIPKNTFYKMFSYQDLDCSGQFTILSVTDYFQYELTFENGKLKTLAEYGRKTSKGGSGRVNDCIDWYLQTWYVWSDGSMTLISEVYVFTTCDGDCAQPRIVNGRSLRVNCNGEGGGGQYCNTTEWSSGVTEAANLESSITLSQGSETRTKTYVWVFAKGTFNPSLKWKSHETGVHVRENNEWKWQSLTHNSVSKVGFVIGGSLQCDVNSATPTVGIYNAIMAINYTFTWSFMCGGSPVGSSSNHISAMSFNVND